MKPRKWIFKGEVLSQEQLNKLGYRTRIETIGKNKGKLGIASEPKEKGNYTTCERYILEEYK